MAVAIVLVIGLVLLVFMVFASYPLPARAHSIFYSPDSVDYISWAAEALHHWPMTVPWVAGLTSHYYVAVFIHFAAVSQVTGVSLSTVVLRLFPATAMVVVSLQLWSLSRSLGRSRWIAPTAVALLLIAADLNLDFTRPGAFAVEVFNTLPLSSSYALGLIFFLGLLGLAQSWLLDTGPALAPRGRRGVGSLPPGSMGLLVLIGILAIADSASKTSALVTFAGGLGLLWVLRVARRESAALLSCGLAVSAGGFLAVYLLMLKGGDEAGLLVHPLDFMHYTVYGATFTAASGATWPVLAGHSLIWMAGLLGATAVTLLCTLVPLAGAGWLLVSSRGRSPFALLALAIFVVSLLAYVLLSYPGNSEGYFLIYGYVALVPIAAGGLVELWEALPSRVRRRMMWACAAVLAVGLAAGESSRAVNGSTSWYVWYGLAYGVLACVVVLAALNLQRDLTPTLRSRAARVLACCVPLVLALSLVKPLMQLQPKAWGTIFHEQVSLTDAGSHQGMTAALYEGLLWVRHHTTPCDVLAVNNHYTYAIHKHGGSAVNLFSHYDYYSAFTERRVLLESWYGTPRGARSESPYPARLALNDLAVVHGSPGALRALAGDGVSYVLIDRTHGEGAPEPASVSRLLFENSALRVYRLLRGPRAASAVGRCGTVSGI
jgi:hypothetical protein